MLLAPLALAAAPAVVSGLFSAGTSIFGANKAQQAAKRSENLAKDNAFLNFFQSGLGRQAAQTADTNQYAFALGEGNFGNTLSDLDFGRQRDAQRFKSDILDPKDFANRRDDLRARLGMEGSLEAKEFNQRQNRAKLIDSVVAQNAKFSGIFGPIAPINVSTIAV